MAIRDFLKGATEIGKAMGVTLKALYEGPVTVEYPRDAVPMYPRFRGKHEEGDVDAVTARTGGAPLRVE